MNKRLMLAASLSVAMGCHSAPPEPVAPELPILRRVVLEHLFSLAALSLEVTILESESGATGSAQLTSGEGNRSFLQGYGCRVQKLASGMFLCPLLIGTDEPLWATALTTLDSLGLMSAPDDSAWRREYDAARENGGDRIMGCLDGAPWSIEVEGPDGAARIQESQTCGAMSPAREAFEKGVERVLGMFWQERR